MKHLYLSLLMVAGLAFLSQAQSLTPDVIASAGDIFVNKNGSLSWTLGESATETLSSEINVLTQGFHQSFFQILKVDAREDPNMTVTIFPNPVNDLLTIEITSFEGNPFIRLELFDFVGQRIFDRTIQSQNFTEQMDVSQLSASLFILRVTNLKTFLTESFKIHKVKF